MLYNNNNNNNNNNGGGTGTVVTPVTSPAPTATPAPATEEKKVVVEADGTKVETEKKVEADGSKVETETRTAVDGTVTETKVVEKTDGTKIEEKNQTSADGKKVITVEATKDANGKQTEASIAVEQVIKKDKLTVDTASLLEFATSVVGDATKKSIEVSFTAKGADGKDKFTVSVDSKLLTEKKLTVYEKNKKGKLVMVEKTFTCEISKDGEITLNIPEKGNYQLVSKAEAKKIDKEIKKSVQPAKKEQKVAEGKAVQFKLDKGCAQNNIAKITYNTDDKSVKVTKNGKIKAKKSGEAEVTATVTLKNGKTKTVKMKIVVK